MANHRYSFRSVALAVLLAGCFGEVSAPTEEREEVRITDSSGNDLALSELDVASEVTVLAVANTGNPERLRITSVTDEMGNTVELHSEAYISGLSGPDEPMDDDLVYKQRTEVLCVQIICDKDFKNCKIVKIFLCPEGI